MTKEHILNEIKRTAKENSGLPLGRDRFSQETGIRYTDWYGKHWIRWSDALREAGFAPNKFQEGYGEEVLIQKFIGLIRELGRIPVHGELRMKRRVDRSFPNDKTFDRLGSKAQLIIKVRAYCNSHPGFDDIVQLCATIPASSASEDGGNNANRREHKEGCVYLVKSGRYYKIGKTNAIGRREYELAIQLPQRARTVHIIQTDDPTGIEVYWHKRFAEKRSNGEWFALDNSDVLAFRRRKFM